MYTPGSYYRRGERGPARDGAISFPVRTHHPDLPSLLQSKVQLSHVLQSLESFAEGKPVALLGDFNALTRSDYSSSEWDAIEAINKANGWKPPRYGCLNLLSEAGYQDAWLLNKTAVSEETKGWTAHVSNPRYRIDYGFLGPGLVKQAALLGCRVATEVRGSDHFPLVVDVDLRGLGPAKCAL